MSPILNGYELSEARSECCENQTLIHSAHILANDCVAQHAAVASTVSLAPLVYDQPPASDPPLAAVAVMRL